MSDETVNTDIYTRIKPFTMADPIEQAGKLATLQNATMSVEKNRRALSDDDAIRAAGVESQGDPAKLSATLLRGGQVDKGLAVQKSMTEQQKSQLEFKLKIAEAVGNSALNLDSAYTQALQKNGGNEQAAIEAVTPMYQQVRQQFGQIAPLPENFDPLQNRAGIGHAKQAVQYLTSQLPHYNAPTAAVGPDGKPTYIQTDQRGGPVRPVQGFAPPVPGTELSKLIAARDALPPDHPDRARYEQAITNETAANRSRGTNVTVNPQGPLVPGKTAAGKIDEDILHTTKSLMQLDQIQAQFKPEFQTIVTKAKQAGAAWKDKLGMSMDPKDRTQLEEFSAYKRNSTNALNEYIKSITGAAMTDAEAQRILRGLPNPGSGVFDGDSPVEFKAKLDDVMKQTRMSVARLAYIKRRGMSLTNADGSPAYSLSQMPSVIDARGKEIASQLRQQSPQADQKALDRAVMRQLGSEFGLVAE